MEATTPTTPSSNDPHCLSSCEIIPGALKRCVRAAGHPPAELHLWVESFDRVDAWPLLMAWTGPDKHHPDVVADVVVRGRGARWRR